MENNDTTKNTFESLLRVDHGRGPLGTEFTNAGCAVHCCVDCVVVLLGKLETTVKGNDVRMFGGSSKDRRTVGRLFTATRAKL